MDILNSLFIKTADTALGLWEGGINVFTIIFSILDAILNPVLSPILSLLNPISTFLGDIVYALLSPLPVWLGMTIISVVIGVVMLIAFRYTSNQDAIGRAKDDIKADLLALKLYKDELRVVFQSQIRLLGAIARLQRYVLTPVLWMLLPILLGLAQMGIRYQWRPMRPGEQVIIKVILNTSLPNPHNLDVKLEPGCGVAIEAGPVPGGGEVAWRIQGLLAGRHTLKLHVDGKKIEKQFTISDGFERVSALRPSKHWIAQLLHPVESPLAADSPIQSIEILYPSVDSWIYGADYWILYFFIVSMAAALVLKPAFNVRF